MTYKDNVVSRGVGATTINEDGSITKDTSLKSGIVTENPRFSDYAVSKEAVFNYKYDIESFEQVLGKPFTNVLYKMQQTLIECGIVNPKPYMARCYRNNKTQPWHKHTPPPNINLKKFWVTIFYMHPDWDTNNDGALQIGLIESENVLVAPCLSNSMVVHNGYYGHGVKNIKLGYEGDRDIFLVHWLSE